MSSIARRTLALVGALLGMLAASVPQTSAEPRVAAIRIVDLAFVPQVVHVRVGQTIIWTNDDQVAHTVTSGTTVDTGVWRSSEPLAQGATFSLTLKRRGTYAYFCKPHFYNAAMHARIVVDG